jgi:cytochrome c-type biogenesis protein CcmH/NrfF
LNATSQRRVQEGNGPAADESCYVCSVFEVGCVFEAHMKPVTNVIAFLLAGGTLLAAAGLAGQATQEQVDRQASKLFDQVMSPFCPGRTLTNCPSPQAEVLRNGIREQLQAGATTDDIWEDLYEAYGDQVRSIPRASGFNLLVWVIPGLFFVLGALLLVRWLRPPPSESDSPRPAEPEQIDPAAEQRLEQELSEFESVV